MRQTVRITVGDIEPDQGVVLALQGFGSEAVVDARARSLLHEALEVLRTYAEPAGVFAEISRNDFLQVYRGEGENEPHTPLQEIAPRAAHLALFAATVGEPVSARVAELFDQNEFALATMLDAAASDAAERAGHMVERGFAAALEAAGRMHPSTRFLRYSPGYCGWHVSGQRALFRALGPDEIGITLRDSCLMEPLKSISGVICGGPGAIHDFDDSYPFCAECRSHECRDRIERVLQPHR